jgi:hypothetical protein
MNALMKEAVRNLHRGRHTQQEGLQRGDFPSTTATLASRLRFLPRPEPPRPAAPRATT